MIAQGRLVISSLLLAPLGFAALAGCHSRSGTAANSSYTVHERAMNHFARGFSLENRGVGAAQNMPRATTADLEEAVRELQAGLQLEPDNHPASYGLADCLVRLNRKDEGVALLQSLAKNQDTYGKLARHDLAKMGVALAK